jgi:hypothetical protein
LGSSEGPYRLALLGLLRLLGRAGVHLLEVQGALPLAKQRVARGAERLVELRDASGEPAVRAAPRAVALQVEFERQTLKPDFSLDRS